MSDDAVADDGPAPGVHVFVAGEAWTDLRVGTADMEGQDVIIHDNETGSPLASLDRKSVV